MKASFILFCISFLFLQTSRAQETSDKDTWYVWMDTRVENDQTRIVSEVFVINCCVKSPKYRRLVKKAEKWIIKNVDENYSKTDPLKKIQDEQLAHKMVEKAKADKSIKLVNFVVPCQ